MKPEMRLGSGPLINTFLDCGQLKECQSELNTPIFWRLDFMILEVFSNFNDSTILPVKKPRTQD